MPYTVPDFETRSLCDLLKAGADRYAEDLSTEVLSLSWKDNADNSEHWWYPGMPVSPRWLRMVEAGWLFVAHNSRFEQRIYQKIMVEQYGWPELPNERWHCTLARCANLVIPQKLEKALKILDLPEDKDMEGSRFTIALSKPDKHGNLKEITPAVRQRVLAYNLVDCRTQLSLHRRIGWLSPKEREIYLLNQKVNDKGIGLDMDLVRAMKRIVDDASKPLADEFIGITGYEMGQTARVKEWVEGQGVDIENLQKETLAKLIGEDIDGETDEDDLHDGKRDLPPAVVRALRIKQLIGSASIKKLDRMEACVCEDGRAHGLLQYHGTGPGRQAGRLLQPHNFPRGTLKGAYDEIELAKAMGVDVKKDVARLITTLKTGDWRLVEREYGPAVNVVVSSLRHTLRAEEDHEFVSGDYAGIQARVVLALAGEHEKTAMMASGADIYCDMASDIYGRKITKVDVEERQCGKNATLGLGFQMGAPKFHWKYCEGQTIDFAQKVVDTYRKVWAPGVPKVWYALQDAATKAVWDGTEEEAYGITYKMRDRWLTARLPSGRLMYYFDAKPISKAMPWDPDDIRPAFQYKAMKLGKWLTIDAFGGGLTENAVMGIERDLMTSAMLKADREGIPIVLEVHDELLAEMRIRSQTNNIEILRQILVDTDPWARALRIPIAVDCWSGPVYRK